MKTKLNGPLIFQRLLWHESILAVKESLRFTNFQNFRNHLEKNLPLNSQYVRKRYTRSILYWFFPDRSLTTLPPLVWKVCHDDRIPNDMLRKENIRTESYPILENLNRRYGLIEEGMVEEVTNAFREELKKAFTDAKKKYGKKTIKITLR
jgi:hypothetical protein